jgi:hypothetical protein
MATVRPDPQPRKYLAAVRLEQSGVARAADMLSRMLTLEEIGRQRDLRELATWVVAAYLYGQLDAEPRQTLRERAALDEARRRTVAHLRGSHGGLS